METSCCLELDFPHNTWQPLHQILTKIIYQHGVTTVVSGKIGFIIAAFCLHSLCSLAQAAPFRIHVVDAATSRGIPQVVLESSLYTRHVTDSNGLVAYDDPAAMGRDVFFKPTSDGYRFDAPPLAMGGTTLKVEPGSSASIVMQREMIAERLYRITGAGIFRDTVALGERAPIAEPMINSGVIGQDSTLCAAYGGKLFWVWGDTSHFAHPLKGNFRATAAMSELPTSGGLAADRGVDLSYFSKGDFVQPMVNLHAGERSGVFWLSCLMNVPDSAGGEHLLAWCNRIEPGASMRTLERAIVEFDPAAEEFKLVTDYPTTAALQPAGHAVLVEREGKKYYYFTHAGGQQTRVEATYAAAKDPGVYEALTCLENDGEFTTVDARIARDDKGRAVYKWRKGAAATGYAEQKQLVEAGLLKEDECIVRPVDTASGKAFIPHGCSIAWNAHRKRWTMITSELMGTSMLGEAWYLEADKPEGPWVYGIKVITHDKYTWYNPLQHPEFDPSGRYIYVEGTYTKTFSAVETPTPYYDYNQIMYRLDLDDERLKLPLSTAAAQILD